MLKKVIRFIRRIVVGLILLYTYNIFAVSYNMIIPINFFTIGTLFLFDIPGLVSLIFIFFLA